MKHINVVHFSTPQTCEQNWLHEEVKKYYSLTQVMFAPVYLPSLTISGTLINKIKRLYYTLLTVKECIKKSSITDTYILWYRGHVAFFNIYCRFLRKNTNLISFIWPVPPKKRWFSSFVQWYILSNPRHIAVINDKRAFKLYQKAFSLSHTDNFYYFPDLYDTKLPFEKNNRAPHTSNYFFTGGMNNRDFGIVLQLARQNPQHRFVLVTLKEKWQFESNEIPANVQVFFNTSLSQYYGLMSKAKAVLLPLLDTRVAGLINIARSIQAGVICVCSRTPATEIYYDQQSQKYLVNIGNLQDLQTAVDCISSYTPAQYQAEITCMQNFLQTNFDPKLHMKKLLDFAENYFAKLDGVCKK